MDFTQFEQYPIFMTQEFRNRNSIENNKGKAALIIIQGKNSTKAGIWDMNTSITEDFQYGTILPQVKWAHDKGHAVLIMNPDSQPFYDNLNEKACFVWNNYIENMGFESVLILAN